MKAKTRICPATTCGVRGETRPYMRGVGDDPEAQAIPVWWSRRDRPQRLPGERSGCWCMDPWLSASLSKSVSKGPRELAAGEAAIPGDPHGGRDAPWLCGLRRFFSGACARGVTGWRICRCPRGGRAAQVMASGPIGCGAPVRWGFGLREGAERGPKAAPGGCRAAPGRFRGTRERTGSPAASRRSTRSARSADAPEKRISLWLLARSTARPRRTWRCRRWR